TKEVAQRYDFKGSKASLAFDRAKAVLTLVADDDFKMKALFDVLQSKLIKRNVPVKNLELGAVTPAANDTVRREITLTQGIPQEKAKAIVKAIKDKKLRKPRPRSRAPRSACSRPRRTSCRRSWPSCARRIGASSSSSGITADETRRHLPRLRQGDRRLRAAGGPARGPWCGRDPEPAPRRRDPGEHLRLHRRRQAGVDRRNAVRRKP